MAELFDHIDELRRSPGKVAVATLVNTRGTTPRKEGAKMLVGEGGSVLGSVTIGGCVDAQVIEQTEDVLNTNRPRLLELNLGDEEACEIGLTCRGTLEEVVEPMTELARVLGYRTIVIDGRPRFATRERFPQVDELRIGIPSELVGEYPLAPSTALVLMAHDYKYDLPVLHKALATDVGYIGMLGSARRGAAILKLLSEEGESEAALKRIRVPIGLDIGARSAPEIALAVMAEIQAVRGGGTGQPMSTKRRGQDASVSGPPRSEPGDERSHAAPISGHPRSEAGLRPPLQ